MHTYLLTRGIKHQVDRFINELSAQYVPFTWNDQQQAIQIAVRPIQLWEIVYPEPMHDMINTTLFGDEKGPMGKTQHKYQQKYANMLRRLLKVDPLQYKPSKNILPIYKHDMELVSLGQKKDRWEGTNEML